MVMPRSAFQIHRIEHLLDISRSDNPPQRWYETVCERRFAVIDMGNDRKIADVLHWDYRL